MHIYNLSKERKRENNFVSVYCILYMQAIKRYTKIKTNIKIGVNAN